MIKRNGVAVMNQRTGNVGLAKETVEILKNKSYTNRNGETVDISASLDAAVNGTILYEHHQNFPDQPPIPEVKPVIEITNETTAVASKRLLDAGRADVVALNFASARNQGGGFLAGAIAQEEDLCRASGLYNCLKRKPQFYNENILADDNFYTDSMIYSPKVPFFRDEHNLFLDKPFEVSIISAPAPNVRAMKENDVLFEGTEEELDAFAEVLAGTIELRIRKILRVAALHGHKTLVLGAWGCGVFGNDPNIMAALFYGCLMDNSVFEHVCFAVYDTRTPPAVYEAFRDTIGKLQ